MNGQLKDINNNKVFNYNNSENITHKNMKLSNFLSMLENKLKSIFYHNICYKMYGMWADKTLSTGGDYVVLDTASGTFNGRKNTRNNPFKLNADGSIEFQNIPTNSVFMKVLFITQCNSSTAGNKYVRLRLMRNGTQIEIQITSDYNSGSGHPTTHCVQYGGLVQNGDKLYFEVYGANGDTFSKSNYSIECQTMFNDLEIL